VIAVTGANGRVPFFASVGDGRAVIAAPAGEGRTRFVSRDWKIEGWVTSYLAIAAGELATVSDVVPTLTGHPARTVAERLCG
jgi:hypothetical protein